MADKQISELTPVGALDGDGMLVVQQGGAAYRATAAQVAALSGGGSGEGGGAIAGDTAYYLDLTGQVEVDSDPRSAEDKSQGFDIDIDAEALLAATGPVKIRYKDIRFDDQVHTVTFGQRMVDDAAEEGDTYAMLYAAAVNPWHGVASAFELEIERTADGFAARLAYWPFAQAQADFEEADSWLPGHIKNSPVVVSNGYTYLNNTPKPTAFDWTDLTCSVPMDDGTTHSIVIETDDSGAVTGITIDGHTASVTGVE